VNTPNLAPGTVLVSVNGDPLRVRRHQHSHEGLHLQDADADLRAAQKTFLDRKINDMLIVSEASKRKVGPEEIIRTEVTEKAQSAHRDRRFKFYEANKANIKNDLAGARMAIITYLQQSNRNCWRSR